MKILDLFAGIGGFSLAGHWAGHDTVAFVEKDPFCQQVLKKNFAGVPIYGDIKELTIDMVANSWYNSLNNKERETIDMAAKKKNYDGAVEMYNKGFSIGDCADYFKISRQAMWVILKRRNVQFRNHLKYGEENHFFRGSLDDDYAQGVVEKAIIKGILIPQPCEICGENPVFKDGRRGVQAHHDDYNKPLQIRWLCQNHHHEWHKDNKAILKTKEVQNEEANGNTTKSILESGIDIVTGGFP